MTAARPGRTRAVLAITRTELARLVRDRTSLFFIVVLPIVIIIIIGATIGAQPDHVSVGVLDLDNTTASHHLTEAFGAGDVLVVQPYESLDLLQADIRIQNVVGGIVIPAGYEAAVAGGDGASITMYADQTQSASSTLRTVANNVIDREGGEIAAAAFATRVVGGDLATNRAKAVAVGATLKVVGVQVDTVGRQTLQMTNKYEYTAPSNLVLFVFVNSLTGGGALVESRRLGVTRRMLAAPITAGTIVLGAGFVRLLVALLQSALILGVGALAFGVHWGDPLAAGALVLSFALLSTGAGLLIGSLAKSPEQVQSIGIPVAIGMAMLGGCMWPLEVVPATVRTAGHLTPHAWAMDGWINVIFEDKGISAIAPDLLVLGAVGVVLIGLSIFTLRRSLER